MSTQASHESDPCAVELGANIHAVMWRRRLTQAQLGALVGTSQSVMSKKLRGVVPITVSELMTIGGVLGVDPAELLPRLDSNQQPSGYRSAQVSELPAGVIDLAAARLKRAA